MSNSKFFANGLMPLSQAIKEAPNSAGCYQLFLGDELVYAGKASDGIRKRFVQYYNGTTAHYSSAQKILANKDNINVKWMVINDPVKVVQKEAEWIREFKPIWNSQSGWGDKGVLKSASKASSNAKCIKADNVGALAPEKKLASTIGGSMKSAAGSAFATAAIIETVKAVKDGEDFETTVGNIAGKGTQAAVASAGGALAGEIAGLAAIAVGAGPVGWAAAAGVAAVGTAIGISSCTDDIADSISCAVTDGVETIMDEVSYGLGCIWDRTIGSWFL